MPSLYTGVDLAWPGGTGTLRFPLGTNEGAAFPAQGAGQGWVCVGEGRPVVQLGWSDPFLYTSP